MRLCLNRNSGIGMINYVNSFAVGLKPHYCHNNPPHTDAHISYPQHAQKLCFCIWQATFHGRSLIPEKLTMNSETSTDFDCLHVEMNVSCCVAWHLTLDMQTLHFEPQSQKRMKVTQMYHEQWKPQSPLTFNLEVSRFFLLLEVTIVLIYRHISTQMRSWSMAINCNEGSLQYW